MFNQIDFYLGGVDHSSYIAYAISLTLSLLISPLNGPQR